MHLNITSQWHILYFIAVNIIIIPCTGMHALKPKLLGNRCTIKHPLGHIFIRIKVGYMVQYIDILKSYLNLNKYMSKKRVLWCYFQVLGNRKFYSKNNGIRIF